MAEINNSFTFNGNVENLIAFRQLLNDKLIPKKKVDNYEEHQTDDGKLIVSFDSFNKPFEYVNLLKTHCLIHKIDFNCTLLSGWDLGEYYCICTYRCTDDVLSKYELDDKNYNMVDQDEDEDGNIIYTFNDVKYEDYDVPGVLGEVMIKYFHGEEKFRF